MSLGSANIFLCILILLLMFFSLFFFNTANSVSVFKNCLFFSLLLKQHSDLLIFSLALWILCLVRTDPRLGISEFWRKGSTCLRVAFVFPLIPLKRFTHCLFQQHACGRLHCCLRQSPDQGDGYASFSCWREAWCSDFFGLWNGRTNLAEAVNVVNYHLSFLGPQKATSQTSRSTTLELKWGWGSPETPGDPQPWARERKGRPTVGQTNEQQ